MSRDVLADAVHVMKVASLVLACVLGTVLILAATTGLALFYAADGSPFHGSCEERCAGCR